MTNLDFVDINLHEAGEYLPPFLQLHGSEYMSEMGQMGAKTYRKYMLELTDMTYLNDSLIPSQDDEDHVPVAQCMEEHIFSELGCR